MTSMRTRAEEYLAMRRSLGYKLACHGRLLLGFAGQMDQAGQEHVTTVAALAWATQTNASPVTRRMRLSAVRCFARHLKTLDPASEVPPDGLLAGPRQRPVPYLYSAGEISALVHAAETLNRPLAAATYQALISLLAVSGLRINEAVTLQRSDVDLDAGVLRVTGKSGKVRLVPLHSTTTAMLRSYATRRDRLCPIPQGTSFFITCTGRPVHPNLARKTFWKLLDRAGIETPPGRHRPRLHDLRHSFAVTIYLGWYRDGVDVQASAPLLSTFLGHRCPSDTYWYLTAAPELLALAAQRLQPLTEES